MDSWTTLMNWSSGAVDGHLRKYDFNLGLVKSRISTNFVGLIGISIMKLENLNLQFRDTSVSTLLRTDTDQVYQFSTLPKDSIEKVQNETIQAIKKKPEPIPVNKKSQKVDNSYIQVLHYKKELSKQDLITKNIPVLNQAEAQLPDIDSGKSDISIKAVRDPQQTIIEVAPVSELKESQTTMQNDKFWQSNDWMIGVILVSLITLAWIRMGYRKLLADHQKALFSLRDSTRLYNEQNSLVQRVSFILNIIFFLNLALFTYQILLLTNITTEEISGVQLFLILLITYVIIFSLRVLLYRFLGYLFHYSKQSKEIIHSGFVLNRITAFILLPFIVSLPFVADIYALWLIYVGVGIFGLLYLLQVIRNLRLFLINISSLYYSILYLCALEIVPVIVLIKFFSSYY